MSGSRSYRRRYVVEQCEARGCWHVWDTVTDAEMTSDETDYSYSSAIHLCSQLNNAVPSESSGDAQPLSASHD